MKFYAASPHEKHYLSTKEQNRYFKRFSLTFAEYNPMFNALAKHTLHKE